MGRKRIIALNLAIILIIAALPVQAIAAVPGISGVQTPRVKNVNAGSTNFTVDVAGVYTFRLTAFSDVTGWVFPYNMAMPQIRNIDSGELIEAFTGIHHHGTRFIEFSYHLGVGAHRLELGNTPPLFAATGGSLRIFPGEEPQYRSVFIETDANFTEIFTHYIACHLRVIPGEIVLLAPRADFLFAAGWEILSGGVEFQQGRVFGLHGYRHYFVMPDNDIELRLHRTTFSWPGNEPVPFTAWTGNHRWGRVAAYSAGFNTGARRITAFPAPGFEFVRWRTNNELTPTPGNPASVTIPWPTEVDVDIEAIFEPIGGGYTIRFEFGEEYSILTTSYVRANGAPRSTNYTFYRRGSRFAGWHENPDVESTRFAGADSVTGDIVLHPKWVLQREGFRLGNTADFDQYVTSADATQLAQILQDNGRIPIDGNSSAQLQSADINGDGYVTADDLTLLARWLVGHDVRRMLAAH